MELPWQQAQAREGSGPESNAAGEAERMAAGVIGAANLRTY